jgi:hypothetical protein
MCVNHLIFLTTVLGKAPPFHFTDKEREAFTGPVQYPKSERERGKLEQEPRPLRPGSQWWA